MSKIKRIHVSMPAIRRNLKCGTYDPAVTVKAGKESAYGHCVIIYGQDGKEAARVIQPKGKKLSCGARVWVETKCKVDVVDLSNV